MGQSIKELQKKLTSVFATAEVSERDIRFDDDIAFNGIVDALWEERADLYATVARKAVTDACYELVRRIHGESREVSEEDVKQIFQRLREPPVQEYTVFRPLLGVYSESSIPLEFGPFTVYHPLRHRDTTPDAFGIDEAEGKFKEEIGKVPYAVGVVQPARDYTRAKELADERFRTFEQVLRFMSAVKRGGATWYTPGIFEQNTARNLTVVVRPPKGRDQRIEEVTGARATVNLDEARYTDSETGNDWIWETLASPKRSNLQSRIIAAVEWLGHGMHDLQKERRFVQFMFALESLFNFNPGTFISQSIGSLITECAAFAIGTDVDSRLAIKKTLSDFYKRRSAVVHGAKTEVRNEDVRQLFWIMTALVRTLTTDSRFTSMKSIEQFHEWVQQQKFS